MKIIEFFGLKVKPRLTRGKRMFKPLETGILSDEILCIRDKDVNCFLYRSPKGYIAIDSGYKKSENMRKGLEQLHISPDEIHSVFLTHLDIDHAGGMDLDSGELFPRAKIYLSRPENEYLKGTVFRKEIGPIRCKMPLRLREDRYLLSDRESLVCDSVSVKAIYAPGHSAGHTVYQIGENLFVGDCMIFDGSEGWCFYDFWNWNTDENRKSLKMLEDFCAHEDISRLISSHSGVLSPSAAFEHRDTAPDWKVRGFHFIPDAEDDPYIS